MIDTFHATIAVCRAFVYGGQFVHGGCELSEDLRSVVGKEGGRESPERDIAVYHNVGSPFRCEFICSDS